MLAEPRVLHRIPANVSFEQAAMTEPFAVAYNCLVERARITPGDVVVIQGAGAIGALCLQIAHLQGAGTIIAVGTEVDKKRLEKLAGLGADHTVIVPGDDPVELVRAIGDGLGANVVVDATGVSAALQQSMVRVRPAGAIVKVGWGPQPLNFSLDPLVAKAATLYGSFSHTWNTWERILTLFSTGKLNTADVLGGVYELAEIGRAHV